MRYEPTTDYGKRVRAALSPELWAERVAKARKRALIVAAVTAEAGDDKEASRAAVRKLAPGMHWSTFRHCLRRHKEREGPDWERQLDMRLPEKGWEVPVTWRSFVEGLGCQDPQPTFDEIRGALAKRFGPEASLCDNTLRKLLREAGLWQPKPRGGLQEKVTTLHGGGGLVLLLAAAAESGILPALTSATMEHVATLAGDGGIARPEDDERDDRGRFTAGYNEVRRERYSSAGVDPYYHSVDEVRPERNLSELQVCRMRPETLMHRLFCVLASGLLTSGRGLAGLDGPTGEWLRVLSRHPYKAASLHKTLSELKLLGAGPALWNAAAVTWFGMCRRWTDRGMGVLVAYVDTTQDPYWTERFAASGKVSRTGRVQPCLSRVCLSTGPGVPVFTEVVSGTAALPEYLERMLAQADELLGPGELGRVTVVDAECGKAGVLSMFAESPHRDVVTVIKGSLRQNRRLQPQGEWQSFRERDRLREALLEVNDDLTVRVVEMERVGGRNPTSTWFATTAGPEKLITEDVAAVYLSRWPHQEDLFRRGRDGVGLDTSHGYGVSTVQNLAVLNKREQASSKVEKLNTELTAAISDELDAELAVASTREHLAKRRANGERLDGRNKSGLKRSQARLREQNKRVSGLRKARKKALDKQRKQETTPDEIYVRDTALDSITTCLKMGLLALLEFVCQEYLGKQRIMPNTFVQLLVPLPVTIRERQHEVIYEVEPNVRDPQTMAALEEAFEIINERRLRTGGKRLHARIREGPE